VTKRLIAIPGHKPGQLFKEITMNRTNIRRAIRGPILASVLVFVFAGTALATMASGFHPTILARGTTDGAVAFNMGVIKFQTKGDIAIVTATVNLDAHASSGWHSHPGVVLVTVKSGTVTFYDDHCHGIAHIAGTSFVESGGDTGLARNESDTPAMVYVTYLVPTATLNAGLRIEQANPGCPQS
jgi:quercetin dioxygenase-like cupin family protein